MWTNSLNLPGLLIKSCAPSSLVNLMVAELEVVENMMRTQFGENAGWEARSQITHPIQLESDLTAMVAMSSGMNPKDGLKRYLESAIYVVQDERNGKSLSVSAQKQIDNWTTGAMLHAVRLDANDRRDALGLWGGSVLPSTGEMVIQTLHQNEPCLRRLAHLLPWRKQARKEVTTGNPGQ